MRGEAAQSTGIVLRDRVLAHCRTKPLPSSLSSFVRDRALTRHNRPQESIHISLVNRKLSLFAGEFDTSTITWAPFSTSANPSLVSVLTPVLGEGATA